jgi:hypothetical protein
VIAVLAAVLIQDFYARLTLTQGEKHRIEN